MATAFNNSQPTIMYNYQTVIPKPTPRPAYLPEIQQDIRSLIFLYDIPSYLDDDDILELLATCGSVKSWDRVLNGDQSRRDHGFCVFEKPISVIKAMRSIPEKLVSDSQESLIDGNNDSSKPINSNAVCTDANATTTSETEALEIQELVRLNTMKIKIDCCTRNYLKKHLKKELLDTKPDFETRSKLRYIFEPFWGYEEQPVQLEMVATNAGNANGEDVEGMDDEQSSCESDKDHFNQIQEFKLREQKRIRDFKQFTLKKEVEKKNFNEDELDFKQWWKIRKVIKQKEYEQDMLELENLDRMKKQELAARKKQEAIDFLDQLDVETSTPTQQPEEEGVFKIMTVQERKQKLQDLLQSIPYLRSELWPITVKLELIDSKMMLKIKQFVTKKLVQLLDTNVDDLVLFIVNNLAKGPEFLHCQVENVLDQEAERFVGVLWRMLVFETEARYLNLQ